MRRTLITVLAAACLAAFVSPAWARDPAPFTGKELNRFISDFPGFVSFMETQEKAMEKANNPETWQNLQMSNRMAAYIEKQGWKPERFFYVLSHVSAGLMAVNLEDQAPEIQNQMSEAQAAVMSNPMISDEMKKQLLAQMQQGTAEAKKLEQVGKDLPAAEKKLIRKNKDRLMELFESQ